MSIAIESLKQLALRLKNNYFVNRSAYMKSLVSKCNAECMNVTNKVPSTSSRIQWINKKQISVGLSIATARTKLVVHH